MFNDEIAELVTVIKRLDSTPLYILDEEVPDAHQ